VAPGKVNAMSARAPRRKSSASAVNAAAVKSYVLEDQIGFILRRVHQRATEIFNAVMEGFDITPTQFAALSKLHDIGETSQNQLGRLIAMDPATMFGVAARLAKLGLVRQSVDPSDARRVILKLTDKGREVVEGMKSRGVDVSRRTVANLTDEEAQTLCRLLNKIV
jgi:MarR family transcriptional regulator, lower aerobic nicotinate degradation pathway regulator